MSSTGSSKTGSRRRRRNAGGLLWALAVLNTVAGLALSTATAPRHVSVHGADPGDLAKMEGVAQSLASVPWARLSPDRASTTLMVNTAIDTVSYSGNVFGRSNVVVRYREAVLALDGAKDAYLDGTGTLFVRTLPGSVGERLPRLKLGSLPASTAGIVSQTETASLVHIVKLVDEHIGQLDYSLEVDGEYVISLRVREGARFVLGSSDKLVDKVKVLAEILADGDQKLNTTTTVNLAAPDRPTVSG